MCLLLAGPSFSSADRAIFIAHRAVNEKLQVLLCHPYGVQARGWERSRHMRGGAGLRFSEKLPASHDARDGCLKPLRCFSVFHGSVLEYVSRVLYVVFVYGPFHLIT